MGYKYYTMRKYSSNCFVFEFNPNEYRLDATIGKVGKLEKLSKINGEPDANEYPIAKINGGFFNMDGSAEYIGSYVDNGLYYSGSEYYYPTLIYWKQGNVMTVEHHPDTSRHAFYQGNAWWAIGVPWTLVIDGKANYTYSKSKLQSMFGHSNSRQPRTMIGQKKDGTVVLVVVDGRRTTSLGMNIDQQAQTMIDLGCHIAVNLDGGGSTEMIVNDKIVNKLSDGAERSIGTAFMVYAKTETASDTPSTPSEPASPPKSTTLGTVTCTSLRVRSGPGTGYAKIGNLTKNTLVKINSESGSWYKILFDAGEGGYGYVSADYIKITSSNPVVDSNVSYGVTTAALNLRKGASTSYGKIAVIPKGTTLILQESQGGWYKVTYNNSTGWVCGDYIKS